ncbi:MAG: zinc-dependent alcohol dehydrogenase family protein [Planctomycetota bacterium]
MVLEGIAAIDRSPLRLRELPDPRPGPGEVRLRVRCCAICRTDLHVIEGDLPRQRLPIIPGHQIVGEVDAVGEGVRGIGTGSRLGVAWLRHTCAACPYCANGDENLCESGRFTGYHEHGGYAQQTIVPAGYAYEIPDAFGEIDAAPLLCAGIIGYRALTRSRAPAGGKLALFGFGSSAHVVLQIALARSMEVFVVSRGEGHRELARELGAAWVGGDATDMPGKVDSAIIFAPAGSLVPPALETLRKGGTLALAGITMSSIPMLEYERHLFHERNLCSVTASTREDGRRLLEEAARIPVRPHTVVYPFEEANRALQDLKEGRIRGTGVLEIGDERR